MRTHIRTGRHDFTSEEIAKMKNHMVDRHLEKKEHEAKESMYKDEIKQLKAKMDVIDDDNQHDAMRCKNGWEDRPQECYRLKDYGKKRWLFFSVESKKVIHEAVFEIGDEQMTFGEGDMEQIKSDDATKYASVLEFEGKLYSFGPKKVIEAVVD